MKKGNNRIRSLNLASLQHFPRLIIRPVSLNGSLRPLDPFFGGEAGYRIQEFPETLVGVDDHFISYTHIGFRIDNYGLGTGTERDVKPLERTEFDPVTIGGFLRFNTKTRLKFCCSPGFKVFCQPAFDRIFLHTTFLGRGYMLI